MKFLIVFLLGLAFFVSNVDAQTLNDGDVDFRTYSSYSLDIRLTYKFKYVGNSYEVCDLHLDVIDRTSSIQNQEYKASIDFWAYNGYREIMWTDLYSNLAEKYILSGTFPRCIPFVGDVKGLIQTNLQRIVIYKNRKILFDSFLTLAE